MIYNPFSLNGDQTMSPQKQEFLLLPSLWGHFVPIM